jgi:hypothetical protein
VEVGKLGVVAVVDEMNLNQAVDRLREGENREVAALVLRDRALQAVIACWPMVKRSVPDADFPASLSLDQLWSLVSFDEREVVELSGISSGLALSAFRRAKGNRLIYPDGSVHQLAKVVLQKMIKDACS